MLCAFNGFDYDFRLLLNHLRENAIPVPENFFLIDPMLDKSIYKKDFTSFEESYHKMFPYGKRHQSHNAFGDCQRLEKFWKVRSTNMGCFIMTFKEYEEFVFASQP